MSAKFLKEDRSWLIGCKPTDEPLTEYEESLIFTTFDSQTDFDIDKINKELQDIKFLKKVCLVKLLIFLPEIILTTTFFKFHYVKVKYKITKLYWKFLFNKINIEELQKELVSLGKEGLL